MFPLLTAAVARRRLTAGRWLVVGWGVYSVLWTALQWAVAHHGSNLWLIYIGTPLEGSLVLLALSWWQERPLYRLVLRWAVVAALVLHVAAVLLLENRTGFPIATMPTYALVCLVASLFTLVSRSLASTEPLTRQDWFWVTGGFAMYFAAFGTIAPLAAALHDNRPALLQIFDVFGLVNILAYAVVAVGLLCPTESARIRAR